MSTEEEGATKERGLCRNEGGRLMKEVHEGRREAIKEGRIVGEYLYSIFELFHALEQLLIVFFLRQSFHVRQTGCLHFQ